MPNIRVNQEVEMQTRDRYTKVELNVTINVNGRELPSAAVLGSALEEVTKLIEERVKKSYEVVPPRDVDQPKSNVVPAEPVAPATPTPVAQPAPVAQPVVPATPATPVAPAVNVPPGLPVPTPQS